MASRTSNTAATAAMETQWRHIRILLLLCLVAILSNASFSTIAPILPLELEKKQQQQQQKQLKEQRGPLQRILRQPNIGFSPQSRRVLSTIDDQDNEEGSNHHLGNDEDLVAKWTTFIFLAYPIGFSLASPHVARHLQQIGTAKIMSLGMIGCSAGLALLGVVFDLPHLGFFRGGTNAADSVAAAFANDGGVDREDPSLEVMMMLLTMIQSFQGATMSMIIVGYYSTATLVFSKSSSSAAHDCTRHSSSSNWATMITKEGALAYIESAVGVGYSLGPIVGSILYDQFGYRSAFLYMACGMLCIAAISFWLLSRLLNDWSDEEYEHTVENRSTNQGSMTVDAKFIPEYDADEDAVNSCFNISEQDSFLGTKQNTNKNDRASHETYGNDSFAIPSNCHSYDSSSTPASTLHYGNQTFPTKPIKHMPTTALDLLRSPKILSSILAILAVNFAWTYLEPTLAERLHQAYSSRPTQIGLIFAVTNIVYTVAALSMPFFSNHVQMDRRFLIFLATASTPACELLISSSNSLFLVVLGLALLGLFPIPVWIMLLPALQDHVFETYLENPVVFNNSESKTIGSDTEGKDVSSLELKTQTDSISEEQQILQYRQQKEQQTNHQYRQYQHQKRRLNDLTTGMYNSFMTLGQIVGYIYGPFMNSNFGFSVTAKVAGLLVLIQSGVYFVGGMGLDGFLAWRVQCRTQKDQRRQRCHQWEWRRGFREILFGRSGKDKELASLSHQDVSMVDI